MNYSQYIQTKPIAFGSNFLDVLKDRDRSITGFYLTLADPPLEPTELEDLVPYIPLNPNIEKGRDEVEEVYNNSFHSDWIKVSTIRTFKGVELYIDSSKLPRDFFLSGELKYSRWFLGYKNNITNTIVPCIYGTSTKDMIKEGVKNTLTLDIDYVCELDVHLSDSQKYLNDLEFNTKDTGKKSPNYYRLGELEYKYKYNPSSSISVGVASIKRGTLKFNN